MTADEFYEYFKDTIRYLNLRWAEMDRATVTILNDKFTLSYGDKSATITIPPGDDNE